MPRASWRRRRLAADGDEALRFLRTCAPCNELREFAARWEVARLLDDGVSYHEISERTGASSATISRVNQWLRYGRDGYRLRPRPTRELRAPGGRAMTERLRLALPNKGRLAEPAVDLLRAAGARLRALGATAAARVANTDLELLFVRTEDVAEYVADGLVELGLTGGRPRCGARRRFGTVLPLGFGALLPRARGAPDRRP